MPRPTPCSSARWAGRSGTRTDPDAPRPEQGLLGLRKGLELFANLRPVRVVPGARRREPAAAERVEGADLMIVRELTGGIYFGDRGRSDGVAHDTCVYSVDEIERIARLASRMAASPSRRGRVTSVDKANILETSRLWRETVERVARRLPGRASSSTCWSTTPRCSSIARPAASTCC